MTAEGRRRYGLDVSKGSTVYRVGLSPNDASKKDYTYVTTNQQDRDYYKGYWGRDLRRITGKSDAPLYEHSYETKISIVAPDLKTRKEVVSALVKTNTEVIREIAKGSIRNNKLIGDPFNDIKGMTKKEIDEWIKNNPDEWNKAVENNMALLSRYANMGLNDVIFTQFTRTIESSPANRELYFNALKKMGYNAVVDDNGRGRIYDRVSDTPLIIFDTSSVLGDRMTTKLLSSDEEGAKNRADKYYNERRRTEAKTKMRGVAYWSESLDEYIIT